MIEIVVTVPAPNYYADSIHEYEKSKTYRLKKDQYGGIPYFETLLEPVFQEHKTSIEVEEKDPLFHVVLNALLTYSSWCSEIERLPQSFYIPKPYKIKPYSLLLLFEKVFQGWHRVECQLLLDTLTSDLSFLLHSQFTLQECEMVWEKTLHVAEWRESIFAISLILNMQKYCPTLKPEHPRTKAFETKHNETEIKSVFYKASKEIFNMVESLVTNILSEFFKKVIFNRDWRFDYYRCICQLVQKMKQEEWKEEGKKIDKMTCHMITLLTLPLLSTECAHDAYSVLFPNESKGFIERLQSLSGKFLPDGFNDITKKRKLSDMEDEVIIVEKKCVCGRTNGSPKTKWLKNVFFGGSGFAYCSNATNRKPSDIDIWILNEDTEALTEVIKRIWSFFSTGENMNVFSVSYSSIINIIVLDKKIHFQIIFSNLKTPWEVLFDFDFDYIKGFYDGSNEAGYLFPECYLSWRNKSIQASRLTSVFDHRLEKAKQSGFEIDPYFLNGKRIKLSNEKELELKWPQTIILENYRTVYDNKVEGQKSNISPHTWFYPPSEMQKEQILFIYKRILPLANVHSSFEELQPALDNIPSFKRGYKVNSTIPFIIPHSRWENYDLQETLEVKKVKHVKVNQSDHRKLDFIWEQLRHTEFEMYAKSITTGIQCSFEGRCLFSQLTDKKNGQYLKFTTTLKLKMVPIFQAIIDWIQEKVKSQYIPDENKNDQIDYSGFSPVKEYKWKTKKIEEQERQFNMSRIVATEETKLVSWLAGFPSTLSFEEFEKLIRSENKKKPYLKIQGSFDRIITYKEKVFLRFHAKQITVFQNSLQALSVEKSSDCEILICRFV